MTDRSMPPRPNLATDALDQLDQFEKLVDHARRDSPTRWASRLRDMADLPESIQSLLPLMRALGSLDDGASKRAIPDQIGDFEILGLLGRGGMGTVYHARQRSLDREVALKVLHADAALNPRRIARFDREAKLVARLSHPSIVDVHDSGEADGLFYFAMRYIDGRSLDHVVVDRLASTAAPTRSIVDWIVQASLAVDHAHGEGVIHRDIKPSNLMVDRAGKLWVLDFGIARIVQHDGETRTDGLSGTLRYVSPERFDSGEASASSDVYSLGAVAFELLTGHPLVAGDDAIEVIQRIRFPEVSVRDRLAAHVPDALADVIADAVSIDPRDRQRTAAALADRLQRILDAGEPLENVGANRRRVSPGSRGKRIRWMALAAAVLLTVVGSVSIWSRGFANSPTTNPPGTESDAAIATGSTIPTIVVTTARDIVDADDGRISLREALLAANASPTADRIVFDISGSPPFRLTPDQPLPVLADDAIVIDGQSDADLSKPRRVELSGRHFSGYPPVLDLRGRHLEIVGLAIVDGPGTGIWVHPGSDGNQIRHNHVGVRVSTNATTLGGNGHQGILLQSSDNTVDRNVISGNGANGIWIRGDRDAAQGRHHRIENNRIGTDVLGRCGMGNRIHGVVLSHGARENHLSGNLVSGNGCIGVFLDQAGTDGNVVVSNQIGVDIRGLATIGNATWGVVIGNASGNRVGPAPATDGVGNRIAGNAFGGIAVIGSSARDNLVSGNVVQVDGRSSRPKGLPSISLYAGEGDDFVILGSRNDGSPQATTFMNNLPWR